MANHLIKRQVLDISLPRREQAIQTQENIRTMYWERVVPQLERIFSKIAPADVVIQIDKLEIDLGRIPLQNLESVILQSVTHQLQDLLVKKRWVGNSVPANQIGGAVQHELQNISGEPGIQIMPTESANQRAFFYFPEKWHLSLVDVRGWWRGGYFETGERSH